MLMQINLDISLRLLYSSMILLLFLLFMILLVSLYLRWRNQVRESLKAALLEKYYPLIFGFLEDEISIKEISDQFSGRGFEYSVFEKLVKDIIDEVSGDDKQKLRSLLFIDKLFSYHFKQLNGNRTGGLLKACNYFSYTRLINYKVIIRLKELISHKNRLVAYMAVSALMASKSVKNKATGLKKIVSRKKISDMAILELLYEFNNTEKNEKDDEIKYLKEIIEDESVPPDNKSIIILAVEELGYYQLQTYLFKLLHNESEYWQNSEIKGALVVALGKFGYNEAAPYIRQLVMQTNWSLVKAGVIALSNLGGFENLDFLLSQLSDDLQKNEFILRSLLSSGYSQEEIEALFVEPYLSEYSLLMDSILQKPSSI